MVDLVTQYGHIRSEIDKAISSVLDSGIFIKGPEVSSFENELAAYMGSKHALGCANGTDALQLAMMALGLEPGDEVITASFTYVATAEVIALLRLTPVLVDVLEDTFCLDPAAVEKAITPKTKAIVPVHLFGQSADMDKVMDIAKRHNLYVIEDNAQAIGADFRSIEGWAKKVGSIGHIGCTSFFPSKNLGCYGDGGAIFTQDDVLSEKLKMMANHGQKVRYYHDEIGVNSRLDALQAAILRIKLPRLDSYIAARQKAAAFYDQAFGSLSSIKIPARSSFSTHVFHQYTIRLLDGDRDQLVKSLNEKGVPANVYYPVPLHQQKAYRSDRYKDGDFPISEMLSKQVFSLPMHTEMEDEQLSYIAESLISILSNRS